MAVSPTITIFGSTGFLGRALLRSLTRSSLPSNTTFRLMSRNPTRKSAHPIPLLPNAQLMSCDVTNEAEVESAVAGSTHVVNLVGILYETPGTKSTFSAIQAEAPALMAQAAARSGVRNFVHVSAIGANSASASAYARTKAVGERGVATLAGTDPSVDVSILRPSIIFGPDDSFFNRFDSMARLSPALPLVGGGSTRFQPVHVDDVAQAILTAMRLTKDTDGADIGNTSSKSSESDKNKPETQRMQPPIDAYSNSTVREGSNPPGRTHIYELGGPTILSFKELMELLMRVTNRRRLLVPIPFPVAHIQGGLFETTHRLLPSVPPMLTRDQVTLLKSDNIVSAGARTFADLGLAARPCNEANLSYLHH